MMVRGEPDTKTTGSMAPQVAKLGNSLLVPCVQELVKKPLTGVPQRYICPNQDCPIISSIPDHHSLLEIPVIDLQKLCSDEEFMELELQNLDRACKEWGFFQLINHGVSDSLVEKVKLGIEQLFNLSMEEKQKYWQAAGELEGFGQAFVVSDEQKLDWGDLFFMITLPPHLRKPHLLPNLPALLRDVFEAYSKETKDLAMKILNFMAKTLRMEHNDMRELFEEGMQSMRMNYYPPCPQPELVMGLNSHSDATGLTILLQVNEMEGLQIKKDETWVPVKPLPNALIVNIGDILEIVSNGVYRSIDHRATVNSVKERMSIATFHNPKLDGEMGPAPSLLSADSPPQFRRIGVADYFKGYFSRQLVGKSYLDSMRIHNDEQTIGSKNIVI